MRWSFIQYTNSIIGKFFILVKKKRGYATTSYNKR